MSIDPNKLTEMQWRASYRAAQTEKRAQDARRIVRSDGVTLDGIITEACFLTLEERAAQAEKDAEDETRRLGVLVTPAVALALREVRGGADPGELAPDEARRIVASLARHLPEEDAHADVLERAEDAPCVCYVGMGALRGTCECKRTGWRKSTAGDGGVRAYSIPCEPTERADAADDDPVSRARAKRDREMAEAWKQPS